MCLEAPHQLGLVFFAQHFVRLEVQDVFRIVVRAEDRVAPVDAAGHVLGMTHICAHRAKLLITDQGAPEEIEVPRFASACAPFSLTASGLSTPTSIPVTALISSQCI
jgi:hypothetical protein